jgi:carboxylesterase
MRLRTVAALAAAAYAARALAARRWERSVAVRLPLGDAGVVRGAEPIDLVGDGTRAVLLLHGFGDTPQTLTYLAEHLHARGWSVRAPLLPGHGRTLRAFAASGAADWIDAARTAYASLCAEHGNGAVAVVGLSMGGALASIVAADAGPRLPALVLLAPYTSMPPHLRRLARAGPALGVLLPYLDGRGARSILDPDERLRSLAYGVTSPPLLRELHTVVREAQHALPRVAAPTLAVYSERDHRIPGAAARAAYGVLGATRKALVWADECGHVVTVDYGRGRVFDVVAGWLDAEVPAGRARAGIA